MQLLIKLSGFSSSKPQDRASSLFISHHSRTRSYGQNLFVGQEKESKLVNADKYRLNNTLLFTDGYRVCKLLSRNIQQSNTNHLARSKINWLLVTTL